MAGSAWDLVDRKQFKPSTLATLRIGVGILFPVTTNASEKRRSRHDARRYTLALEATVMVNKVVRWVCTYQGPLRLNKGARRRVFWGVLATRAWSAERKLQNG